MRMNRFAKRCLQVAGFSVNLQTAFGSTRLAERRSDFNAAQRPACELIRRKYATYPSRIEDVIALHPTICVAVENAAANAGE
jgi:hypothetical protein